MKTLAALGLAATLAATTATAGGMAEPVMEMAPDVVVADVQGGSSATNLIIPLILIALIAAAVSSSSGGNEPDPCTAAALISC